MNKTCARCEKTVYPTEELKCLDKRPKPRVSHKQRAAMFKFMLQHPDFAKGRVTGHDAAEKRANLIKEMSSILNAIGMGATKPPEKWWKCWQDWRCDSKAKAKRIKMFRGRPGDMPGPPPLTELEESLLQFCGIEVTNEEGNPDPLEVNTCSAWHKGCFKCQECGMTLNMRTYKGYGKLPYCEAHVPKAKHTTMAETPELKRIAENTKLQSNVKYHADFEKSKGKCTQVADDPETLRIRENTRIFSNVTYHGDLEKKAQMEKQRQNNENGELVDVTADYHQQIDNYASEMLPPPHLPPKSHYQTPVTHYQPPLSTQNVQYHQNHQNHNPIPPQNHSQSQIHSQNQHSHNQTYSQSQTHSQNPQNQHSQNQSYSQSQTHSQNPRNHYSQSQTHSQNPQNQHSQNRYDQSRQEQKYDYYKKEEYYGYQPGYQNIGKIQDYDPETDGPRAPINSPRAMPTLVYNSNDNRGAHQPSQSQPRQIGRVTDLDPLAKEPRASNQQPPPPAPQVNQKVYIAMYDYEANDNDEVSFREGDLIGNVSSIDEGWMTGQVLRTGRAGMLPANYVVERPPY